MHKFVAVLLCNAGSLIAAAGSTPVQVIVTSASAGKKRLEAAWSELVLLLQLSEGVGEHVVRALGYVEDSDGTLSRVMEACGGSLRERTMQGRLPAPDAVCLL